MQEIAKQQPEPFFCSPRGRISRASYVLRLVPLLGITVMSVLLGKGGPSLFWGSAICVSLLLILVQTIKRARDVGWHWAVVIPAILIFNGAIFLALAFWPAKVKEET